MKGIFRSLLLYYYNMRFFFQHKSALIFNLLLCLSVSGFAQTERYSIHSTWDNESKRCIPCDYNELTAEVMASKTVKINFRGEHKFSNRIDQLQYEDIVLPSYYDKNALPNKTTVKVDFGTSRSENYLIVSYDPLINVNGQVKLVKKIDIEVSGEAVPKSGDRGADFASVSVLKTGDWYKIGVSQSGVHKLDYTFLNDLGINMSSLNPNHINIYGNHVPTLPVQNNAYHPDDLIKNSIVIQGDADGVFNASDYILFYATGPDPLYINPSSMIERKGQNDSLAYYFIHVDASDAPKRLENISNSSSPVTHTVSKGNAVALHEVNSTNLLKSGDGWIGEHFDIELVKNVTLNLEEVTTDSVSFRTVVASYHKTGSCGMKVVVNGVTRDYIDTPAVVGEFTEANVNSSEVKFITTADNLNIQLTFERTSPSAEAWLDYILVNYVRNLRMGSNQFTIRSLPSTGVGNVVSYNVSNATSALAVWEITDPTNVRRVNGTLSGSMYNFIQDADSVRSFIAFNSVQAHTPVYGESITNQNLHSLGQADYLIVTHPTLRTQADRLADLHRAQGTIVHVVNIGQVYNEFSGGAADPVAVRWFAKMFYDRAEGDPSLEPENLCLFGDGTYDPLNRVANNNYLLPTYQSVESGQIDYINSYTSDDFFGILDDLEGMGSSDLMDIGVGRIPVSDLETAEDVVNKIEHYMNYGSYLYSNASGVQCDANGYSSTFGDWRTRVVLMADDEDNGTFVEDCENLSDTVENKFPEMNVVKIYLDAYQQVVTSGGQRYPDVEEAINQNINKGALVFNYVGHGGETGLSLERVVTIPQIESWSNINNLTIFISATCEFSRYDDPGRISAGEITLTTPFGGAVSMLTTTRLVYINVNTTMVKNLYSQIFLEENGKPLTLGEIMRRTKVLSSGSGNNRRAFSILGDPALRMGKPRPNIVTDSLNGVAITAGTDSLKALSKITVKGHVENASGSLLSSYNGIVFPTVYDKAKIRTTLGQDSKSPVLNYDSRDNIIYKGKSTVTNGRFEFSFVVPKDIDYEYGKGKISYYSNNTSYDNYGLDSTIVVGGVDPNGIEDNIGPEISLFMNDKNFANGGLTDESPQFMAEISDENGINTTGNGIGHDITLIIDGNTADPIILNNFYEADLDTYQSGTIAYPLSNLEEGEHQLTFKVWDVNNNSSEESLDFVVVKEQEIGISHLLNYPNPFTTNTDFFFEHNQVCNSLDVKIEIFTVSGKVVKTILETVNTTGFRSDGINWDGKDEYGDKLGRGVYVYRLSIETPEGKKAEKIEKLVIL